ncbi:MAG: hypothetical protein ACJA0N_002269 [Pseudohongiellaceae bacterium]|jgi:hypothetical protein
MGLRAAANNMSFLKSFFLIICVVLGSSCLAQTKAVKSEEVLKYVSRNVLKTFVEYENKIEHCDQLMSSSQPPKLDKKAITTLKVVREDAVLAVGFLKFRNYFLCEQEQRLKLAFQLGTLESFKKELNQEIELVEELQSIASYPSKKELELEVKYFALPKEVRDYFESTIGDSPFELVDALEVNGLMR